LLARAEKDDTRSLPFLAHRDISLRCGIWLLSGIADIEQAAPTKLDCEYAPLMMIRLD
jgi:hypothetical protein